MKIEIEVPNTIKGPNGREWEPTGEIKTTKANEWYAIWTWDKGWIVGRGGPIEGPRELPVVRRKRWRADVGETFYVLTGKGHVVPQIEDGICEAYYRIGNYFRTTEEAMIAGNRVLAAFKADENDQ